MNPRPLILDGVGMLTTYLVLLFLVPANLVFGALGSAGSPAQLFGLVCGGYWMASRIYGCAPINRSRQLVLRWFIIFAASVLISYVAAMIRPIDAIELRSADRILITLCSWAGVFLLVADGLATIDRIDVLLRRLVLLSGLVGTLGILQFITKMSFVDLVSIPGLTENTDLNSVYNRNGLTRPAGTATHPIEFGVSLTMILPFALRYAFLDTSRALIRRWYPVVVISVCIMISISRSALVAALVVLVFLLPTWPKRRRVGAYGFIALLFALMYVAIPGLLGTLVGLFTGISDDGSARSRTDSYGLAWQFVERSPLVGRGPGTFLPSYRILDNQYLGILIEMGFLGLIAVLILFMLAAWTGVRIWSRSEGADIGDLAQATAACVAAGACSFATFDAFGFPLVSSLLFFAMGLVVACNRVFIGDYGGPLAPAYVRGITRAA